MNGVIRTRVGYAGGKSQNPTYHHLGDHTETVQVDFDPGRISYAELLSVFWKSHNPGEKAWSRQYMNVVFYQNDQQRQQAMDSKIAIERQTGAAVNTLVLPLATFYLAEDYHQKYLLKRHPDLAREIRRIYPQERDLINSTAAARINGYAGGNGRPEQLTREIESLGLSPAGQTFLTRFVKG